MNNLKATTPTPDAREFKIKPPTAFATCEFHGTITNNTSGDLVLQYGQAGAPARIPPGESGHFYNDSPTAASGRVCYASVDGTSTIIVSWNVPWIGTNDIGYSKSGNFYVQQGGDSGGYSPSVTWAVSVA